jgi:outer membrane protein
MISLNSTVTESEQQQAGIFGGALESTSKTGQVNIVATQNIYTGGRVTAQVSIAEAQIRAGREQLRSVEATVLLNVIQAYCDVIRDRSTLAVQRDSLKTLTDASDEIRARHDAGANTSTDVDQAAAQVEATRALVAIAEGQLENSVGEYVAYVGQSPGDLETPPPLTGIPATIDKAFDAAEDESPNILQAQFNEAGARAQIREAKAALRPTLSFSGSYGETSLAAPFDRRQYNHASAVSLNFTQPIYSGGAPLSHVRQAIEQDNAQRLQVDAARRGAVQAIVQAWGQRRSAHLSALADDAQVKVARSTYEGMREEYRAGLRTTLDVLYAEQTLTSAQVAAVDARHDEYVAAAALLAAVGRLEVGQLVRGVPLYNPASWFRQVQRAGSFPLQFLPQALDHIGAPTAYKLTAIPQPPTDADHPSLTPVQLPATFDQGSVGPRAPFSDRPEPISATTSHD